jgi:sugar transport system substrate-binding protein
MTWRLWAIGAVVLALAVAGCGSDDDDSGSSGSSGGSSSSDSGGGGGGAEGKTVAMIAPFANPFQTDIRRGAEDVADQNGVDMIYLNFNANSQQEFKYVNDVINRKVDLVIYGANDAKVSLAGFKRIAQAGIPIVCFDTCVEEQEQEKYTKAFVTSDNVQLGTLAGEGAANWIKDNVDGKAKLAFVTCNTQSVCRIRWNAQVKALESAPHEVVANQVAVESDKVKTTTEGILQANPDLDIIVTDGLPQTEGGTAAIENLDRDVVLFGMDMTDVIARDLLKPNGPLQAAVGQDGKAIGSESMKLAVQVLNGEDPPQFLHEIPGTLYTREDPAAVKEFLAAQGG